VVCCWFCYIHRHPLNSFRNFRVFSIQIYQLYAYPSFWAMSSRQFTLDTLFIRTWKYRPLSQTGFKLLNTTLYPK
jgi:hypothetical protein